MKRFISFLIPLLLISAFVQQVEYDIYQPQIENLILETDDYFTSASLLYPGLRNNTLEKMRDSADGRRHLIIGSNEIGNDEMMGTCGDLYM